MHLKGGSLYIYNVHKEGGEKRREDKEKDMGFGVGIETQTWLQSLFKNIVSFGRGKMESTWIDTHHCCNLI